MATIKFSPDVWATRIAGFPRLVASVYLDICLHNWRTGTSMSLSHFALVTGDLGQDQAMGIAEMLAGAGKVQQDENGIWAVDAIADWNAAEEARLKMSAGGRRSRPGPAAKPAPAPVAPKQPEAKPQEPAATPPAPAAPNPEDEEAIAKIRRAEEARAALEANVLRVGEAWNEMATKAGLTQIQKMSDKRKEATRARIREHGIDAMLKALETVPQSPFLTGTNERGWQMDFDAFVQASTFLKLVEGRYHNQGEGRASGWR